MMKVGDMKVGDMIFVRDSECVSPTIPVIIIDIYKVENSWYPYFVVLVPNTGEKFTYQEHNLSEYPGIPL